MRHSRHTAGTSAIKATYDRTSQAQSIDLPYRWPKFVLLRPESVGIFLRPSQHVQDQQPQRIAQNRLAKPHSSGSFRQIVDIENYFPKWSVLDHQTPTCGLRRLLEPGEFKNRSAGPSVFDVIEYLILLGVRFPL